MHAPRQIQPAGSLECRGWRLKLYGIRGRSRPVPAQLIEAADKQLYASKRAGRNRVTQAA